MSWVRAFFAQQIVRGRMLHGDLTLKQFVERYDVDPRTFRETLGLSAAHFRRLLAGQTTTMERAREIYVATGGHVDANGLAGLDAPEVQSAALKVRRALDPPLHLAAALDRAG